MLTKSKTDSIQNLSTSALTKVLKEIKDGLCYAIPYAFPAAAVVRLKVLFKYSPFVSENSLLISFLTHFA